MNKIMNISILILVITVIIPLVLVAMNKIRMDIAALIIALILGLCQLAGLQMVGASH